MGVEENTAGQTPGSLHAFCMQPASIGIGCMFNFNRLRRSGSSRGIQA
jgi:hypothetical protein